MRGREGKITAEWEEEKERYMRMERREEKIRRNEKRRRKDKEGMGRGEEKIKKALEEEKTNRRQVY